jgi:hypothetical protein
MTSASTDWNGGSGFARSSGARLYVPEESNLPELAWSGPPRLRP